MTARANKLTMRATSPHVAAAQSVTNPSSQVRVFVDALERLGYDADSLLAKAGVRRSELTDPDGRVPCSTLPEIFCAAMRERPLANLAARLARETPIGAFPLLDYLVLTSETVGAALKHLARYLRLADAPVCHFPAGGRASLLI